MNVLIGAAVLLLAGSAVALVSGWGTAEETLIWTSIGASVAAGVVLAVAYMKSRRAPAPVVGSSAPEKPEIRAAPTPSVAEVAAAEPTEEPVVEAPAQVQARPARAKTRPRTPTGAKSAAAKSTAKSKQSPTRANEVVAIPERKKFHRPDCRFAHAKGAAKMTKAVARRRNYEACGICKP